MKKNESMYPSGVTQEMIDNWKKEHPAGINLIKVTDKKDPNKKFVCVVKTLSKRTIGLALKFIDKDLYKACDVALKNEWLAGDEIIKEKAEYVVSAGSQMLSEIDQAEAELINL